MSPNDFGAYLDVLKERGVGAAVVKFPGVEFSVTFVPDIPEFKGADPTPGGWKSPQHLDDYEAMRAQEPKLP